MVIKTIRSLQELETVRAYWNSWQNHPNTDFDHFRLVCQLRQEVVHPHVTVVERNGGPCALLAARLEQTHFVPSIGYFKPFRVPAKVLTVLYRGLLGEENEEIAEALFRHLWSLLVAGEADAAVFHHLTEHSPLIKALMHFSPPLFCKKKLAWSPHWSIDLPGQPEELLKKMRSNHRRRTLKKQRELESAFRGKMSWQWYKYFDDIPRLCSSLDKTAELTYHRGLSAGFRDNEEYRQRFALFAGRQQLRAQLLEIDGRVRAFWIGNIYNNVFHASETGYDPDLHKFEVGTLGLLRTVDELVREGVYKFDFGFGDADYKKRFANQCWREATVRLFAPTAKGMALRSSLRLFGMLDGFGRHVLQRVGAINHLKTFWRRRLASVRSEVDKEMND